MSTSTLKLAQETSQENGQDATVYSGAPIDFDFLKSQTFDDELLEKELLELFVTQMRQILSSLSTETAGDTAHRAHLLKGSARGIGAWPIADLADRYETADASARADLLPLLAGAIGAAEAAIIRRLDALGA